MYGSFHHLILDGMSIKLFLQKQEQLYLEGEKEEKEDRSALLELEEKIWNRRLEESQNLVQASCSGRNRWKTAACPPGRRQGR